MMVPRPGYEFVPHNEMRLGQTGNFTDKERQTYIIIDVRDGNCFASPLLTMPTPGTRSRHR
ncbi:hypothetical protein NXV03_15725 [Phocaeicola vulgatus]|nr:hypothetical protein [Phocaeicola vulgatus]